ncbi:MAG TPA: glycosyltransferase family 9 protein [Methylomirabilota bacterium]|nr:glycosyltransferase family 9 protein [Methylomirabilota bacterium]
MESRILIIHPGALGDVLQAVPALRGLRAAAPAGRLVFAGQPRLGRLLGALGVVDETRAFDGLGLEALFIDEPAPPALATFLGGFTRVVSWFGSREPTYVTHLGALVAGAIVARPVPDDDTPVWRHLIATLPASALAERDAVTPIRPAARPPAPAALVIHPGSGGTWKQWPAERFAEAIAAVATRHALPVVVHQGPADRAAVEALLARLDSRVERLVEPELPELAAALSLARAYLGGDSGVSHLAAAVGAPSVILFPPAHLPRFTPWSPTARPIAMTGGADEVAGVVRELERALSSASRRRGP